MQKEMLTKGITQLSDFVKTICSAGIRTKKDYSIYAKKNKEQMAEWFDYAQDKGMPPINNLVSLSFHATEPLVLLNYTPLAHNTLFAHKTGWTLPLRLTRGIIFDFDGRLVAKGFPKFFNYKENEEACLLPDEKFEATVKMDGHLGIIFEYAGKLFITTRGSFESNTTKIATKMLAQYSRKNKWPKTYPQNLTTLVEIIHPATKVLTDYANEKKFVIIGAFDRNKLDDLSFNALTRLGQKLKLPVTEMATGLDFESLAKLMKDHSISNQEGYVVRFQSGLRVKLKFETYISKMIADKISYAYLMKKFMSGQLKDLMDILDEEVVGTAKLMLADILIYLSTEKTPKEMWRALYGLVPEEETTSSFQATCRNFVKAITLTQKKSSTK